ncbi:MAG: hypothetical protein KKA73_11835 [Chloroflexi bacterium]|nr:hypothetical protein [Chloroflexota bacterium]MBU1748370.1 hypothetical protein [Chloroflexota bacterium]
MDQMKTDRGRVIRIALLGGATTLGGCLPAGCGLVAALALRTPAAWQRIIELLVWQRR